MKKTKIICIIIFLFICITIGQTSAEELNSKEFNQLKINISKEIPVATQINGVTIDYNVFSIDVKNTIVTIEENDKSNIYQELIEEQLDDNEINFYTQVAQFSEKATVKISFNITVENKQTSEKIKDEFKYEKTYKVEEILSEQIEENCCIIQIYEQDLKKLITNDVVFKSEKGGTFQDSQNYIEYTGLLPSSEFPDLPELFPDEDSLFYSWYNENEDKKIKEFPQKVTDNMVIVARWKLKSNFFYKTKETDEKTTGGEFLKNYVPYNPPKTMVENNVFLLIVSYIISMTTNIG